jgi:hypothetical protein
MEAPFDFTVDFQDAIAPTLDDTHATFQEPGTPWEAC